MAITKQPTNDPTTPNSVSAESANSPAVPNSVSAESAASAATPNSVSAESANSPAVPNSVSAESANSPAVPNSVSAESAASAATPNSVSAVTAAGFPRSVEPRINFDFGDDLFEINGVAKALTDAVTYTRNSSATYIERYVDQFGKYNYRLTEDYVGNVENLVTYSEQFDNAAWAKTRASIQPNKIKNPINGARDADLMTNTDTAEPYVTSDSITITSGATCNVSFHVRTIDLDWCSVTAFDGGSNGSRIFFNLNAGIVGSVTTFGTGWSFTEGSVKYVGDGWYRITGTVDTTGTTLQARFNFAGGDAVTTANSTGLEAYIWGAQVTESVKPLPYVKTISSPVTETFSELPRLEYDPATGEALGYLAEGSSTNLVTYSEQFDNAAWTKTLVTVTPNDATAPDGSKSADKLIESSSSGAHTIGSSSTSITSGNNYTLVVFAKAAENSFIQIIPSSTVFGVTSHANFDLVNGLLGTVNTGEATIKNYGNGWYKCSYSLTAIASSSTGPLNIGLITSATANRTESYAGDGSSGIYIWGAQVEEQPFATSYIRTEGSTVSRSADVMTVNESLVPRFEDDYSVFSEFNIVSDSGVPARAVYHIESPTSSSVAAGTSVFIGNPNVLSARSSSDAYSINPDVEVGATRFAITKNQLLSSFYINGVLSEAISSTPEVGSSNSFTIGDSASASNHFNAHVKQITIYNVALTAQEVALL